MGDVKKYRVIIIGSGPAGLTAALYCSRAEFNPLVIEGTQPGGQLMITTDVENFPGFPDGIQGPELMQKMRQQAERFGTQYLFGDVSKVDLSSRPFKIWVEDQLLLAEALIITSGASSRLLGLPSEKELMGYGVSACATCDGFFFKGKKVFVVGGGDAAMEESLFLTKFASRVTVIHRRDQLRASRIMQERAFKNEKIDFIWNSVVVEIIGTREKGVTGVKLKDVKTGEVSEKKCDGVFIAIGHAPNTRLFKGQVDMDKKGYIITHDGTRTNIPGVFAAGDVQDYIYKQAVTASGSGCMAAIDAERFLESEA